MQEDRMEGFWIALILDAGENSYFTCFLILKETKRKINNLITFV